MNRPLRLATLAVPLSGNKGSASMLLGLRDAFATAGIAVELEVFSYYPRQDAAVAQELGNVTVHPGHPKHLAFQCLPAILLGKVLPFAVPAGWRRHIARLRQCDGVLLIGGTTFADSMLYKVPWNVLAALPGYLLGRPTVFLSQTVGPLRGKLNRAAARWTLRRAHGVHGRGRDSERWVRAVAPQRATYRPDLSFSMRVPPFAEVAAEHASARAFAAAVRESGRTPVGVAPNSIVYAKARKAGKDYVAFLVDVVQTVAAQGHLPVLIPHSYRADIRKLHNNDRSLCLAVRERLPAGVPCFYVDGDLSAPVLRALIGELHLLVASRFHSMISALAMGVPPITYGWGHHKYSEVLAEFGVGELYSAFDELDHATFAEKLRAAGAAREELAGRIRAAGVEVKAAADAVAPLIVETLRSAGVLAETARPAAVPAAV